MTRTTITIDEKTLDELHRLAAERGISVAALVREALEEKMERSHSLFLEVSESLTLDRLTWAD